MSTKLGNISSVSIEKNTTLFDDGKALSASIRIGKWVTLKYLLIPENEGKYVRQFTLEEGAIFRGAGVVPWANMVLEMSVSIEGSRVDASLQLLALATEGVTIEIDGIGRASSGCENVKLRVDQTNILLGSWARVKGRPVLEVATDSIEWGHSCRIHRISGESLFYLQSHGIDAATAEGMLLEAEIMRHVAVMNNEADKLKGEILGRIMKK